MVAKSPALHAHGLIGPASSCDPRLGDTVDQDKQIRPECLQTAAGTVSHIKHFIECSRIVQRTKHHGCCQFEPARRHGIVEFCWIFRQKSQRSQLHALIPCIARIIEHTLPARIAGIIAKFNTPGTRCVSNSDCHSDIPSVIRSIFNFFAIYILFARLQLFIATNCFMKKLTEKMTLSIETSPHLALCYH